MKQRFRRALLAAAVSLSVAIPATLPANGDEGLVAEIRAPVEPFKLRQGRSAGVRIDVRSETNELVSWMLRVRGRAGFEVALASGQGAVFGREVARLDSAQLEAGESYTVLLEAEDGSGTAAASEVRFLVPDPQYALIPLEEGNIRRNRSSGLSMDRSGGLIAMGGDRFGDINILDTRLNRIQPVYVDLQNSDAIRLSGDGRYLVFTATFEPPLFHRGLGFMALDTLAVEQGPETNRNFHFSTDATARRVVFASHSDLVPGGNTDGSAQYFLYDRHTGEIRQLTDDPGAVPFPPPGDINITGLIPLISADGTTVALATTATLGIAPEDPDVGARIFAYDVPSATLRYVYGFPTTHGNFGPSTISEDGRYLIFVFTRVLPPPSPVPVSSFPARLDLWTGVLEDPLGDIFDHPSFDAAAVGDGSLVVIFTQDDRDPRVGNADHNMELFLYDTLSGDFTQITETVGGIGRFPGGCSPRETQVSWDGSVVAFLFSRGSGPTCQLDGPQQDEETGFTFRRVRAVRKRPGNRPVVFPRPADLRVQVGRALEVTFEASDPDGDPVVFYLQQMGLTDSPDIPLGSDFVDHRDGTATFTWAPRPEDAAVHRIRVGAFDEGGGQAVHELILAVCSRIETDATPEGVVRALFTAEPPASCRDADTNGDHALTAADLVRAAADSASE